MQGFRETFDIPYVPSNSSSTECSDDVDASTILVSACSYIIDNTIIILHCKDAVHIVALLEYLTMVPYSGMLSFTYTKTKRLQVKLGTTVHLRYMYISPCLISIWR